MKRTVVIRVVVAVVAVVFVVGTWAQKGQPDLAELKFFSLAVLVSTVVFNLWDFWLWRLAFVQWIPGVPRSVRGTWKGTLTSLWIDPTTGRSPAPKPVFLVVRQTGSAVTVTLLTDESKSTSAVASVTNVDGSFMLTYSYLNKPDLRVEHRSRIHHGSAVFDISGRPAKRLKGRYWTDRDSKGELDFAERSEKLADDYAEARDLFVSRGSG